MRIRLVVVCWFVVAPVANAVDFAKDVRPIFAKACVSCHGEAKQKGGLRLDRKADALQGGDDGAVIVAKKSAESPLFHRVRGTDPDKVMPPKGEKLSAKEIAILQEWIDAGAEWPDDGSTKVDPRDWWSLRPLQGSGIGGQESGKTIDGFILAKLKEKGLQPSPEADRRTLIRRLSFDLIGLPPTLDEIDSFVKDSSPNAYEKLVDRLLASPHHGERWARHWLDVVHFGETHGYDKDKPRPNAWPYRDYVIRAFNSDKPYTRFVQEQIAGDVLFPGTVDGIEALGFLAAGPWDFIGHAELPESKIDGKIARHLDRDDFVANTMGTFQSLTVHCAQCHNHKFDPITQEEYYALQAVFAAIDRTDRTYDSDPKVAARRAELEAKRKAAANRIGAMEAKARAKAGAEFVELERRISDGAKVGGDKKPEYGYHSAIEPMPDRAKWVQVDLGKSTKLERVVLRGCDDDFNKIGAGFGFPLRFKIELSDDADFQRSTMVVDHTSKDYANPRTAAVSFAAEGKAGRYLRVTATKLAPRMNDFIFALAELEAYDAAGTNLARGKAVTALDSIEAPVRWRKSNLTDGIAAPGPKLIAGEIAKLTRQRDEMLKRALGEDAKTLAALRSDFDTADGELKKMTARQIAYVGTAFQGSGNFAGTGGKPREIRILPRGDITKPGKIVAPGSITALGLPFPLNPNNTEGDRRAALAKWLTAKDNPLTWRSIVNRVWQYHFGRGLVDTPNDFGKMGQQPTHPELLDWLAMEFRDGGGSLKKLHKLIVMSATYRQVSTLPQNSELKTHISLDQNNAYLWRQNRRKLEAEAVRDSILTAAGKLDRTMGGPSFQDFVVEKPEHSPHYQYHLHDPEDAKSHRRAVYRFTVRSKLQPFMASFDCADPSLAVEKRNESLSPQQALALLNNRLTLAMAKHFAARVEKLTSDPKGQVTAAFRLAIGRDPTLKEADALAAYAKEHGLPNACRAILNLNEFVFVD
jgi:mono/diheme cytochrome c family protein